MRLQVFSKQIYLESQTHFPSNKLLSGIEDDRVPHLLALAVPLHFAIKGWRLPCFSMGIVRPHCVHLKTHTGINTYRLLRNLSIREKNGILRLTLTSVPSVGINSS